MATRTPTIKRINKHHVRITYDTVFGNADIGTEFDCTSYGRPVSVTAEVTGTFGGATVAVQGSVTGADWASLKDPADNALNFTAAGSDTSMAIPPLIRARTSGGTGTSVTVSLALIVQDTAK